jgi:hypothetical protein
MNPVLDRLEEAVAAKVNRRGLLAMGLRSLVGVGLSTAALLGGRAGALIPPAWCHDHYSSGNTCGMPQSWCDDYRSGGGCGGLPFCSSQYCQGSTSNCAGGYVSHGYWDCCCDFSITRCRDCGPPSGAVCICRATNLGEC